MSYRRALLTRWSRRDRLAVLVVAVTVAFLVGTTLLVFAAGAQTASIAAQFDSPGSVTAHETPAAAAASDTDAVVLPLDTANGTTVVGIPANASVGGVAIRAVVPSDWTVVEPHGVSDPERALAVHPDSEAGGSGGGAASVTNASATEAVPDTGVPLLSALAFFVAGTSQALVVVAVVATCGGLLVAVTTYSVTRMSVRDRRPTIRIVRATGGRPRTVIGLFAARAGLLTAVGVATGYAIGVIATNAAVNVAVAAGLPTSLAVQVSPRAVRVLLPLFGALVGVGVVSGIVAAWRAARAPPGSLTHPPTERAGGAGRSASGMLPSVRARVRPAVLGWRPLVPTAATLTAFVLFVALAASLAGVVAPLSGGSGPVGGLLDEDRTAAGGPETSTILQPDSVHPVSSNLPAGYADALRAQGVSASPEILLFEVIDGQPVPARGANFTAFSRVTDAELRTGRTPRTDSEAIVGADLAATLDLSVGERLLVGGSTDPAVTRVDVVGTYTAPGPFDDQIIVPLPTARSLSGIRTGQVNLIRTAGLPASPEAPTDGASGIAVTDLSTPDRVRAGDTFSVNVTVRNDAPTKTRGTVTVRYRDGARQVDVNLAPIQSERRTVTLPAGPAGERPVRAGNMNATVQVVPPGTLSLRAVPTQAPPGSEPLIRVVNASGVPAQATVTVANGTWNRSVRSDARGRVRLPLPSAAGAYSVVGAGTSGDVEMTIRLASSVERELEATLQISPESPSTLVRPAATVKLSNPWNQSLSRSIRLSGAGASTRRDLTLGPGASRTVDISLPRRPPGQYTVVATLGGERELSSSYRVRGDDRIVAALATSGRTGSSGIGQAIAVAFGNLGLIIGTLVLLAGVMTVGGTTAAFAAAVAARRRTLGVYRATGATPAQVGRLVLGDALRIGIIAGFLAVGLASLGLLGLGAADLLVVFGVRIGFPTPAVLALCWLGAVLLTLVAAGLALVNPVSVAPGTLLRSAGPDPSASTDRTRTVSNQHSSPSGSDTIRGDDDD
jgi:hypothetical protein